MVNVIGKLLLEWNQSRLKGNLISFVHDRRERTAKAALITRFQIHKQTSRELELELLILTKAAATMTLILYTETKS